MHRKVWHLNNISLVSMNVLCKNELVCCVFFR